MSSSSKNRGNLPYTQSQLAADFRALGVARGQTLMLHASVNAVGQVMGGPNVILAALLEVLSPTGTLLMYAGWQDIPDYTFELPPEVRALYHREHPPFDPAISRSVRENSVLTEFLRTWRGTERSLNPEASIVANGAKARWITQDHPLNYGYGIGSPLAKLVESDGSVLLLGAPLYTLTLLHYAENRAKLRHKNIIHYECPILQDGKTVWVQIEDFTTGEVHDDYTFEQIAEAYLAMGRGRRGSVGAAECYLFEAKGLANFAIRWLEERFG